MVSARCILGQIVEGLLVLHKNNIMHRDISMGNVLLSRDRQNNLQAVTKLRYLLCDNNKLFFGPVLRKIWVNQYQRNIQPLTTYICWCFIISLTNYLCLLSLPSTFLCSCRI